MRLSDFLFLATLAAIPIQLGKFFWIKSSFVLGIPIDYRAVSIYFADIIIFLYICAFLLENRQNLAKLIGKAKFFYFSLFLLNLYLVLNAFFISSSKQVSYYFCLKIFLVSLFASFALHSLSRKNVFKISLIVFSFSLVWQSLLLMGQFSRQSSLGLWILGERSLNAATVNIAHSQIFGKQLLRPYGTFSHPNVVAAFVLIYLILSGHTLFVNKLKKSSFIILLISLVAVFVTFSKSAILVLVIYSTVIGQRFKYYLLGTFLLILLIVVFIRILPSSQIATYSERLTLVQAGLDIALKNPLFGVGSGNFILELSKLNLFSIGEVRLLQPVHNVFLLILAENGIIGLVLFGVFLTAVVTYANTPAKIGLFLVLLVFATFDHFLWTINQGRLIFWLAIAYILSKSKY